MCEPSGARHEIVKTVAPVIGAVEAPPESELCEKLPSGEVSVQFVTPCEVQKIEVRVPKETVAGEAQMSTFGSTVETTGVVVVAVIGFAGVWVTVTVLCCTGFVTPTV